MPMDQVADVASPLAPDRALNAGTGAARFIGKARTETRMGAAATPVAAAWERLTEISHATTAGQATPKCTQHPSVLAGQHAIGRVQGRAVDRPPALD